DIDRPNHGKRRPIGLNDVGERRADGLAALEMRRRMLRRQEALGDALALIPYEIAETGEKPENGNRADLPGGIHVLQDSPDHVDAAGRGRGFAHVMRRDAPAAPRRLAALATSQSGA